MEKFKNSTYIALSASCITSIVACTLFAYFIYPKNPLDMPNTTIGLLTIMPFILFFVVTIVTVPIVVIPIRKQFINNNKIVLKGIYEILLYLIFCILLVIFFDFIYQFTTRNKFGDNFAMALKSALIGTDKAFDDQVFKSFGNMPFLVQNLFTFIMGILFSSFIIYPISISIAKKISKSS